MKNATDRLEAVALDHLNRERIWSVAKAMDAIKGRFGCEYCPSYISLVLVSLSKNGPYPGVRSIFRKIGKDSFVLLSHLSRKKEKMNQPNRNSFTKKCKCGSRVDIFSLFCWKCTEILRMKCELFPDQSTVLNGLMAGVVDEKTRVQFVINLNKGTSPRPKMAPDPEEEYECPLCGQIVFADTKECPSCHILFDNSE